MSQYYQIEPGYDGEYYPTDPETPPAPIPDPTPTPAAPSPQPEIIAPGIPARALPVPIPRAAATRLPVPVLQPRPRYSGQDYAGAAQALLPTGRVWPAGDSVQASVFRAFAETFVRSDGVAGALLDTALPGSVTPMLPEWEATLGLPDRCAGEHPDLQQRLDQVRGRFFGAGGQSRQRFIDFAAALGFTITITNYAPFRAGLSTVGNPIASDAWTFVWGVTIVETTGALSPAVLQCEFEAVKPAETTLIFLD
ncbi:YmfQ family protein [Sphingomonas sp. Leaf25]|uniref:YmfQ family protein n=1 Tax=Sphingomonas sp. Leaf25 TaxID=1735692 RepID=UPI0006FF0B25|nr:putative phage tail protein [Sphingomonas sp. Leaf25]KQN00577.1 hypothetical protein ASE78_05690 [Sphingomonas sp. Leaf25]